MTALLPIVPVPMGHANSHFVLFCFVGEQDEQTQTREEEEFDQVLVQTQHTIDSFFSPASSKGED